MSGSVGSPPEVERRVLVDAEFRKVRQRMLSGPHATVGAGTRTREVSAVVCVDAELFEMVLLVGTDWVLTSGPVERLLSELVVIPQELEALTGICPDPDGSPFAIPVRGLGGGELLALAETVRRGDLARIDAACEELDIAGLPWWVSQFAWGAEAAITLVLVVDGTARLATMLQLLPSGWGCLHSDSSEELHFRPLSATDVQARLGAFVAILRESAYAA